LSTLWLAPKRSTGAIRPTRGFGLNKGEPGKENYDERLEPIEIFEPTRSAITVAGIEG
jgi:hypothetical protein